MLHSRILCSAVLALVSLSSQSLIPLQERAPSRDEIKPADVAKSQYRLFFQNTIDQSFELCAEKMNEIYKRAVQTEPFNYGVPIRVFEPTVAAFHSYKKKLFVPLRDVEGTQFVDLGGYLSPNTRQLALEEEREHPGRVDPSKLWSTNLKEGLRDLGFEVFSDLEWEGISLNKDQFLEPLNLLDDHDKELRSIKSSMTHAFIQNVLHLFTPEERKQAVNNIFSVMKERSDGEPSTIFVSEPMFNSPKPPMNKLNDEIFTKLWKEVAESGEWKDKMEVSVAKEQSVPLPELKKLGLDVSSGYYLIDLQFK